MFCTYQIFGIEKGIPPFQQDFHKNFGLFSLNIQSFGMLTILKIGKDLIFRLLLIKNNETNDKAGK